MEENPYTAPLTENENDSSFLGIRHHYEKQELAIKLIGFVFILFGLTALCKSMELPLDFDRQHVRSRWIIFNVIGGFFLILILALGYGLLTLKRPARTGAIIWCLITLFGFPVGTVIGIYFLYTLFGAKTSFIFSTAYREVQEKTPDFRHRLKKSNWTVYVPNLLILGFIIYFILLR